MVMPAISPALRSESEEPLEELSVSVSVLGSAPVWLSVPVLVSAGGVSATAGVTVTGASVSAAAAVSANNGFFMLLQ